MPPVGVPELTVLVPYPLLDVDAETVILPVLPVNAMPDPADNAVTPVFVNVTAPDTVVALSPAPLDTLKIPALVKVIVPVGPVTVPPPLIPVPAVTVTEVNTRLLLSYKVVDATLAAEILVTFNWLGRLKVNEPTSPPVTVTWLAVPVKLVTANVVKFNAVLPA